MFYFLFFKILAFYLKQIFALHTQHKRVISRHGCVFPPDMTTRHKQRRYIIKCSSSRYIYKDACSTIPSLKNNGSVF